MPKLSRTPESIPGLPVNERSAAVTRTPRWIHALDVLCLVLLALILRSLLADGYRIALTADLRISLRSPVRLAAWLTLLLAIRHAAWREVPWHHRLLGWLQRARTSEPLRAAWPAFALSRAAVLAIGYVAVVTIGFDPPRPWRALENGLLDLFARWDAGWYMTIASTGYPDYLNPSERNALAFFPGLPLLMRGVGILLDINLWAAGIVVVTATFLWALTYVYRLAELHMTPDRARVSVMLLAFYPFAVCYSAILTEAPFLLAAAASFYHFQRRELTRAAPFALLAGGLRPNGFLLCAPLGLVALIDFARSRGWLPPRGETNARWPAFFARLAVASLPLVGVIAYSAHVYALTGDPIAWAKAQQAWGRASGEVLRTIAARSEMIAAFGWGSYPNSYPIEIFEAIAVLFALASLWPITRRFGVPYALFVAMAVIPPFVSMGSVSLGRYTAPLFPLFLWLGAAVPERHRAYWIAAFASGQALVAALFFTWRAPY